MGFKVTGLKEVKRNLQEYYKKMERASLEGMQDAGELVADDSKNILKMKGTDPTGGIAESVKTVTAIENMTVLTTVTADHPKAFEVEMGPEGGFLFVSQQINRGRAYELVASRLRRVR